MKLLLLILLIVAVIVINKSYSCAYKPRGLNEPFGEPQKGGAGSVHVSVWDGSSENEQPHIKGQAALVNAIMTFGSYWTDVLQESKAGEEQINPLVYSDLSIQNISHKSVPRQLSPSTKIRYMLGSTPQAEVYEFQVPVVVGAMTHRMGDKLVRASPEEADKQRYIAEMICRPDVIPVLHMTTREQFLEYMRDYIKTNVQPYMHCTEQKLVPHADGDALFTFQFIQ